MGRDGEGKVDNEQQILQNIQQLQAQIAANNKSALKLDVLRSSPIGAPLSAPTATSATASSSAELLNVLLGNRPQSNTSHLPARGHLSQLSVTASANSTVGMSRKGGPGVATLGLAQEPGVGLGGRRESGGGGVLGGGGGGGGGGGVKATDREQQQLKEQIELLELQIKLQIQNAGGGSRPSWL